MVYHVGGAIQMIGNYVNGKIEGKMVGYTVGGGIAIESCYVDGELQSQETVKLY